jgi:hypothetical protein
MFIIVMTVKGTPSAHYLGRCMVVKTVTLTTKIYSSSSSSSCYCISLTKSMEHSPSEGNSQLDIQEILRLL